MGDDPEAPGWVMDNSHGLSLGGAHVPGAAQEINRVVGIEAALKVDGQMQVQQRGWWRRTKMGAFFFERQLPGGIGNQPGGAANMLLVVPRDLSLQEGVGRFVIGGSLVGQEGNQPFLEGVKAAFNLALGRSIWSDPMGDAQSAKSTLELGMSVETVDWRAVSEQRQAIGVEASRGPQSFERDTGMDEVIPGGVAAHKRPSDDFAGVIIDGQDEHRVMIGRPPRMWGTVVLPQLADGSGLPAAAWFGTGPKRGHLVGEMQPNIRCYGCPRAVKIEALGQFVGDEGEIERLAMREEVGQKRLRLFGPRSTMRTAGANQLKASPVLEPSVT